MKYTTINKINESQLFNKYKSSYKYALFDLSRHIFFMGISFYLLLLKNRYLNVFIIPFNALLLIRSFIIVHDCWHNSYMPNKELNYIVGSLLGIFIVTPFCLGYQHWNHHLENGRLSNGYDFNETVKFKLSQYKNWDMSKRYYYKIITTPFILFSFFPIFYFLIKQRMDVLSHKISNIFTYKESIQQILFDTVFSNIGIVLLMYYLFKIEILGTYIFTIWLSTVIIGIFFHNQHTFNPCYVVSNETWNLRDSGLYGSSFIKIPYYLKYFANGIEYHHIHHMNSKIPGYNLQKYHEEVVSKSNMFDNIVTLSWVDCYNNLWLILYDEDKNKYITLKEADEEIEKNKNT